MTFVEFSILGGDGLTQFGEFFAKMIRIVRSDSLADGWIL